MPGDRESERVRRMEDRESATGVCLYVCVEREDLQT